MAEWAGIASALVAAVGLVFAGWQLLLLNRQARYDRRVAYDGVVVSWRPVEAPDQPDANGWCVWLFEVTVHNPGRLPIDNVEIRWYPATEVCRVRYHGGKDAPTSCLPMDASVLAGGQARTWERRITLPFANKGALDDMYATVTYTTIDNDRRTNRWPRVPRSAQLAADL
jgi:hypothetical protein